jgi:RecA-family ATPase
MSADEIISAPRPVEIVEGFAWAGCLSVLVSESGTGKTFVLLDVAAAVSSGKAWHRRDVLQGSVAYLSYEGDALGLRLRAIRDKTGHRLEHLYVLRAHDPLSPHVTRDGEERSIGELTVVGAVEALAAKLLATNRPPLRILVIDTVRASLVGSEDSSEHVAAYLRAVRRIMARVPDAAGILAHHAGWQDGENQKKRERGSSAWRGNCDATLYLETGVYNSASGQAELTLTALKVRDAEKSAPLYFVRRRVDLLERDRHGAQVTSCIIEPDPRSREDRDAETAAKLDQQQSHVDLELLRTMAEHPEATTSKEHLGVLLNWRKTVVIDALGRLVCRGWVRMPTKQRQPYTLTDAGIKALEADELARIRSTTA